jgi:ubiquinone/menaquinone biosynthesis C-methylase UbiE
MQNISEKKQLHDFWNEASCGEKLLLNSTDLQGYENHSIERYRLEPYIKSFADFGRWENKNVLEIGVGLGADHKCFADFSPNLFGIDLTERAIAHTKSRIESYGLKSTLAVGDAENLNFPDNSFDLVYSWGVLHHSPNTQKAVNEVFRVLKDNGEARIMIYNKWSVIGLMLWFRYAFILCRPFTSLTYIYSQYLESPGTKAYTFSEARKLFSNFSDVKIEIHLSHGDLLTSDAGQRHRGFLLSLAKKIWPRWIIRKFFPSFGLFMLISAKK